MFVHFQFFHIVFKCIFADSCSKKVVGGWDIASKFKLHSLEKPLARFIKKRLVKNKKEKMKKEKI